MSNFEDHENFYDEDYICVGHRDLWPGDTLYWPSLDKSELIRSVAIDREYVITRSSWIDDDTGEVDKAEVTIFWKEGDRLYVERDF